MFIGSLKKFTHLSAIVCACVLSGCISGPALSQNSFPHDQAHAHNDYEHQRPLLDALSYGFMSVEADVHLSGGKLFVAHDKPGVGAPQLETAYLLPLDSILKRNGGRIFSEHARPFFLMIDIKTRAVPTYRAIRNLLQKYPELMCGRTDCPVKVFLSGNRPMEEMMREGYEGIGLDGRPADLGKGYSAEMMPVISDRYNNWSTWDGASLPADLERVAELAKQVHREGKLLRLWAAPDDSAAWNALLEAGVDMINSDKLKSLHEFLSGRGVKAASPE